MGSNGWEWNYGKGENAKGLVSQVPNNTMVDGGWFNNDLAEVPPGGGDPTMNENIPVMVKVREYERKPPSTGAKFAPSKGPRSR